MDDKLGNIYIATKVSILSSHNAYPSEVHFEAALYVLSYFKGRNNSRPALDPIYPTINYKKIMDNYWAAFYGHVKEVIPPNTPTPLVKSSDLHIMFNSNHAGDKMNRQSHTGFLIFCNMALINWLSKRYPTMESAVFRA